MKNAFPVSLFPKDYFTRRKILSDIWKKNDFFLKKIIKNL